jgi:hypothetical protein
MKYVCLKPEFLIDDAISGMCAIHVIINLGYWHDKIDVIVIRKVHYHSQENNHGSVFEVRELNIHGSEFNSPVD